METNINITIQDAEDLYNNWHTATIYHNGVITFVQEEEDGD